MTPKSLRRTAFVATLLGVSGLLAAPAAAGTQTVEVDLGATTLSDTMAATRASTAIEPTDEGEGRDQTDR